MTLEWIWGKWSGQFHNSKQKNGLYGYPVGIGTHYRYRFSGVEQARQEGMLQLETTP